MTAAAGDQTSSETTAVYDNVDDLPFPMRSWPTRDLIGPYILIIVRLLSASLSLHPSCCKRLTRSAKIIITHWLGDLVGEQTMHNVKIPTRPCEKLTGNQLGVAASLYLSFLQPRVQHHGRFVEDISDLEGGQEGRMHTLVRSIYSIARHLSSRCCRTRGRKELATLIRTDGTLSRKTACRR